MNHYSITENLSRPTSSKFFWEKNLKDKSHENIIQKCSKIGY